MSHILARVKREADRKGGGGEAGGSSGKRGARGRRDAGRTFASQMTVVEVTEENFDEVVSQPGALLLEFYLPDCEPCAEVAPEVVAAAEEIARLGYTMTFASVDCDARPAICRDFGVTTFPLTLFRGRDELPHTIQDQRHEYQGNPTRDALVEFVLRSELAGPELEAQPVTEITGQGTLDAGCLGVDEPDRVVAPKKACIFAFLPDIYEGGAAARRSLLALVEEQAEATKALPDQSCKSQGSRAQVAQQGAVPAGTDTPHPRSLGGGGRPAGPRERVRDPRHAQPGGLPARAPGVRRAQRGLRRRRRGRVHPPPAPRVPVQAGGGGPGGAGRRGLGRARRARAGGGVFAGGPHGRGLTHAVHQPVDARTRTRRCARRRRPAPPSPPPPPPLRRQAPWAGGT